MCRMSSGPPMKIIDTVRPQKATRYIQRVLVKSSKYQVINILWAYLNSFSNNCTAFPVILHFAIDFNM